MTGSGKFSMAALPIIIGALVGCLAGLAFARLNDTGIFETWSFLNSPPEKAIQIIDTNGWSVYVKTQNDAVYVYSTLESDKGWTKIDWPTDIGDKFICGPQSVRVASAPGQVIDSAEISHCSGGEDVIYTKYALLSDGSVWMWRYGTNVMLNIWAYIFGGCLGSMIGVIFGGMVAYFKVHSRQSASCN